MAALTDPKLCRDYAVGSRLEWILTNGLGGYAMGTVSGSNTRRYHGLLVAATSPPTDRMVLLAAMEAHILVEGKLFGVSTNQYVGAVHPQGYTYLQSFHIDGAAVWEYRLGDHPMRRTLSLHPGKNACTLVYENLATEPMLVTLRPLVCHKFYHDNFRVTDFYPQYLVFPDDRTVLVHNDVKLSLDHPGADRTATTGWYYRFEHPREIERGLDPLDDLYCPCELRYYLDPGEKAMLVASTEEGLEPYVPQMPSLNEEPLVSRLERAVAKYLVSTPTRTTIMAGYPWFTDWGRDTMVSLPGVCLTTGKVEEARSILRSYAREMSQGLIPNRFADRGGSPEYNTVDATLWFVNSAYLTLQSAWDEAFALEVMGWIAEVYEWHMKGTHYGIAVDPEDGLLRQGVDGYQLTWMDAKVGDWVVTPRHGKPIEVNGLWVNALRVGEWLASKLGQGATPYSSAADLAEKHFEEKYWKASLGHFLDTVDPDDGSLRPNQLIAMALPFAPLKGEKAEAALAKIRTHLLTPNGLRTLGPNDPGYHGKYEGTMPERDAAYHRGTVWPWLIGPYVSAVLRVTGDKSLAAQDLRQVDAWLEHYGLEGVAEVYDGDEPQSPGGCPWQAWSVAEALRALKEIEAWHDAELGKT
ncbi:MAG: glycogen debranching enzyme family protein [Fimbriimonadaceae bacterium]|nr:glycogen debranching enzyme family protein [Fimbriimonadaceae bacterium]QYK57237.1 MAG: glycogen debranching enzyme family protein [Fimbriimonadaceae bacterium]